MARLGARLGLPAALAVGALLAGCGGNPTTRIEGHRLDLRMDEFRYRPQKVEVRRGQLEIRGRNVGRLAHNVNVWHEDQELASAKSVQPGGTARLRVRLGRGTYRLECSVGNHDDLGMYGTLIVR
jgi:plastocyanin